MSPVNATLVEVPIGPYGSIKVIVTDSNPVALVSYNSEEIEVSASVKIKSKAGLEYLKQLIPGKIDDAIISVIEAALGM